jgi:hypothetical protein
MNEEKWIDISGHEGKYQVSTYGKIRNVSRDVKCKNGYIRTIKARVLRPKITNGYRVNMLGFKGEEVRISRCVALHLIPNPENKPWINPKDGNKLNDNVDNLEWCTPGENLLHAYATGLMPSRNGEKNPSAKLTKVQVEEARGLYIPFKMSANKLAKRYGISPCAMLAAIKGKSW